MADTAVIIFVYFGSGIMVTVAVFLHWQKRESFLSTHRGLLEAREARGYPVAQNIHTLKYRKLGTFYKNHLIAPLFVTKSSPTNLLSRQMTEDFSVHTTCCHSTIIVSLWARNIKRRDCKLQKIATPYFTGVFFLPQRTCSR